MFGGSPSWSFDQCVSFFVCISSFLHSRREPNQFCIDARSHRVVWQFLVTGFSSNLFKAFTWLGVSVGSCFISLNLWVVTALTSEANVEQILSFLNISMVPLHTRWVQLCVDFVLCILLTSYYLFHSQHLQSSCSHVQFLIRVRCCPWMSDSRVSFHDNGPNTLFSILTSIV